MNILVICNKSPWPALEGGPMAMNNLIEGLIRAGQQVKVLALNTNKYSVNPETIPEDYRRKTGIELSYVDLSVKPLPALLNLFTTRSYHVERFKSKEFEQKLISVLKNTDFDIIQIELLYMSPYIETIRKYSNARVILRAHNIEHLIWMRLAETGKNPLRKLYLNHLAKTLKNYEYHILDHYDGVVPITRKDAEFFSSLTRTSVHPVSFGIHIDETDEKEPQKAENALFHIGAMNWMPNEEGIRWFLDKVWPLVHKQLPEIKLYLAGRMMPGWLSQLDLENVIVEGEVPDAGEFIRPKTISIAPLLSGSGIRVKIIESMSWAKAVVSTSIGAEGINYTDNKNIMIADTPEEFAKAIEFLYNNPEKAEEMGRKARELVRQDHDIEKIIRQLLAFYREIL